MPFADLKCERRRARASVGRSVELDILEGLDSWKYSGRLLTLKCCSGTSEGNEIEDARSRVR